MFKETTLRPIVSSISTYNHHIPKFLTDFLDTTILTSESTKDSFTFFQEIKKVSTTNRLLISCDIFILFTSIPVKKRLIVLLIY